MRNEWIVRWRGLEERWPSPQDAMDRLDQLDARGIEAEMIEVGNGASPEAPQPGTPQRQSAGGSMTGSKPH